MIKIKTAKQKHENKNGDWKLLCVGKEPGISQKWALGRQEVMGRKFVHNSVYAHPESRKPTLETLAYLCSHQISVRSVGEICYHIFCDPAQTLSLWPTTMHDK